MRILINGPRRSGGIPWWLIVGGLGFLIFGGWRGFVGAIAGVILIPIAIVIIFALGFFLWSVYLTKKLGKNYKPPSPFEFERQEEEAKQSKRASSGDVFEAEATIIKSEKED
ncbi:MAG: hypothetical protein K2P81_04225 [Bacteriovoracaceae bacterium]|nr:hypothetical protein [Bacteriovoracaceae bacterium]